MLWLWQYFCVFMILAVSGFVLGVISYDFVGPWGHFGGSKLD
jgi:hypothetical protein